MNPPSVIRRLRGCFIGGPLHGAELPSTIRPGGRLRVPGEGEAFTDYVHRRLEDLEAGEELELLVLEGLDEGEAAALADAERTRRGGWGEPLLVLPAAGFVFKFETHAGRGFDADGAQVERLALGIVTRLSRAGACIAAHLCDESRPLSREEVDATRCGWCEEGIGHTLEEHRARLAATAAAERAMEFERDVDDEPLAELPQAIAQALYGPHPDLVALEQFQAELQERVLQEAHAEFIRRRQAELVVPDQEETAGAGLVIASGYRSRGA